MKNNESKATIIVLTRNSEKTIYNCLKSVSLQNVPLSEYEVIIIDNGSTDKTLEIVKQFEYTYYVYSGLNIAQLRNIGIKHASAQIVGFVDSDCEISYDWIINGLKWFNDKRVAIVGCKYKLPANATFIERNWISEPSNINIIEYNSLIPAGNMIVSKEHFFRVGGFDESLITSEDSNLLIRIRKKGYLTISDPIIKNIHYGNPKTIKQFYKKEVWYGLGGSRILQLLKDYDKPFLLSNIVLALILFVIYCICSFNLLFIMLALLFYILMCVLSAVHRRFILKIRGNFFFMIFMYMIYLIARTNSLLYIYNLKKYNKVS